MVNILHLVSCTGMYGAPKVALVIARRANAYPFASYIAPLRDVRKSNSNLEKIATQMGLKSQSIHCRGRFDLGVISQLTSIIKKHQISIIHSHNYKTDFYGLWVAKLCRIPIVVTVHGLTGGSNMVKIYEYLDPFFLKFSDVVVPVSERLKDELIRRGVSEKKIKMIPNGIDTDRLDQDKNCSDITIREKWGINRESFVVGTAGRLSREKGHIYLLQAIKDVIKRYPQTILILAGDGPSREELMTYTRESGLEDYVIFTGYQEDMSPIYAMMDLVVLPSLTEGIPLVLLEAMSVKKPVVATRVGGIPEVIKNEENGILVKPKSSEDLVNAIIKVIEQPRWALGLGLSARKTVEKSFSSDVMSEKYNTLYKEMVPSIS